MLNSILIAAGLLSSGLPDNLEHPVADTLHSVTVTADKGVVISRKDTLSTDSSFSLSDVLKQSPGLHIGDNGGYAGLKTVSLRGLGSAQTSIYIDGVRVGNVQSGQSDLGMIDVGNLQEVVVDYAQNTLSFNTSRPSFGRSPLAGSIRFSAGSFGTYLPSARLDFRISDRLSLSANAAGVFSKGNYRYGDGEIRMNNDICQIRSGIDLFGLLQAGDYHIKAYFNQSERGTPGSVSWPSDDRQKDRNVFLQGRLSRRVFGFYDLALSVKAGYDDISYTSILGASRYEQTEIQANSSHRFRLNDWWKVSVAADVHWDGLYSTNYQASRWSILSALATSFTFGRLSVDAALEYAGIFDIKAFRRHTLSPSVDLKYLPCKGLALVAFSRRSSRVPVFNELYYAGYGNPDLKPEDALLNGIGADYIRNFEDGWTVEASVDAFFNLLADKILSSPSVDDPDIWLPYNVGRVRSGGFDAAAGAGHSSGHWKFLLKAAYTFQSSVDRTEGSAFFGCQIPYVARHTASIDGDVIWKGWRLDMVWQWRGGRSDGYGVLPDYDTFDVNIYRAFVLGSFGTLVTRVAVSNLLDCRYETVSGYPMPGRSFIGGVEFRF